MPPAETAEPGSEQEVGIPGFWVRALATNDVVSEIIEENDIEVLNFLSDVRCVDHEDMTVRAPAYPPLAHPSCFLSPHKITALGRHALCLVSQIVARTGLHAGVPLQAERFLH